jgi:hypothetical protein
VKEAIMGTNIINSKLSRTYTHHTRAKEFAEAYAKKMRKNGYTVEVLPANYSPDAFLVEVMRKR